MKMKHWQDPINALLGLWLIVSPWAVGFSGSAAATVNFVGIGIVILAVAMRATYLPGAWEEWSEFALGIWMLVSPWLVQYAAEHAAKIDAVVTGAVVLILGFWAGAQEVGWHGDDAFAVRH